MLGDPSAQGQLALPSRCLQRALLTPRSRPGQMPHADLGALPTFLVYRYTMRLPGVRDLKQRSHFIRSAHTADRVRSQLPTYSLVLLDAVL